MCSVCTNDTNTSLDSLEDFIQLTGSQFEQQPSSEREIDEDDTSKVWTNSFDNLDGSHLVNLGENNERDSDIGSYPQKYVGFLSASKKSVSFPYLAVCNRSRECNEAPVKNSKFRFKISKNVWEYNCVRNAFKNAGFIRTEGREFNVFWGKHMDAADIAGLRGGQKVNHFPGTSAIGRKDRLAASYAKMRRTYGTEHFNFHPMNYILPQDKYLVTGTFHEKPSPLYIVKPCSSSCGRGIRIVSTISSLNRICKTRERAVLQKYIRRPYLINGFKFDLRLYVVVTSFNPLIIYWSEDGLVRFTTTKYSLSKSKLHKRSVHLTNYSVQKKQADYIRANGEEDSRNASKWNIKDLWSLLRERHGNEKIDILMKDIESVIIKTLISCESTVVSRCNVAGVQWNQCFELFGFDVLLDKHLKPWLLEVNILPSLSSSSTLDKIIKSTLVCDMFHTVGFDPVDIRKLKLREKKRARNISISLSRCGSRVRRRNVAELCNRNLNSEMELHEKDIELIQTIFEQFHKQTSLKLIFPTINNVEVHRKFFEVDRYNNVLLWKFLNLTQVQQINLLERHNYQQQSNLPNYKSQQSSRDFRWLHKKV